MGLPDIGLATLEDFARVIRSVDRFALPGGWIMTSLCGAPRRDVSTCSGLPVVADADTGFGEVGNIPRVVYEYSRAGAAALHIEDQVSAALCS
jgi:methylisocitrate lyase